MFYSTTFLTQKGKFAIVWLAATKPRKLKRREYESVDIEKTCNDILNYLPQARDLRRPIKRPLLSLYLASQLMYGVVVVFDKKQKYFLEDLKQIMNKMKNFMTVGPEIDMARPFGRNIDMEDPLETLDPAFFENFGQPDYRMTLSPAVMSFGDREYLEVRSARSTYEEEGPFEPRHIAPISSITLNENDWNLSSLMPEDELAFEGEPFPPPPQSRPVEVRIGDWTPPLAASPILQQPMEAQGVLEQIPEELIEPPPATAVDEEEQPMDTLTTAEEMIAGEKPTEETVAIAPETPHEPPPAPTRPIPHVEPDLTFPPEAPKPRRRQAPVAFELNPLDDEELRPAYRRGTGKRARLFLDRGGTCIPTDEMRRQIEDLDGNSRLLDDVIAKIPRAENLFERPILPLGRQLLEVYEQNLIVHREPGGFDAVFRSPPWTVQPDMRDFPHPLAIVEEEPLEGVQPTLTVTMPTIESELISPEKGREGMERELTSERQRTMDTLGRPLESGTESTTPDVEAPAPAPEKEPFVEVHQPYVAEEQPIMEEQQFVEQPVAEEVRAPEDEPPAKRPCVRSPAPVDHLAQCYPMPPDMPNGIPHTFALQREQLEMTLYEMTSGGRVTTFDEVCPTTTTTKPQAAKTFFMVLELCRGRKFVANQLESYGQITIKRSTK